MPQSLVPYEEAARPFWTPPDPNSLPPEMHSLHQHSRRLSQRRANGRTDQLTAGYPRSKSGRTTRLTCERDPIRRARRYAGTLLAAGADGIGRLQLLSHLERRDAPVADVHCAGDNVPG